MKISIAMATYNGARYLQEQLDSFLEQTKLPDELVVTDDCSSDETVEILDRFSVKAPFMVRVYKNDRNLGYIKNFEKALSLCEGDIIFLSDQDDVWFPEKINTMSSILLSRKDIYVLQADMVLVDQGMNKTMYTQLGNIQALGFSPDTFLAGCGSALRREWLGLVFPIPSNVVAHDNWIHRLALSLDVRALYEKPLQYYRRHDGNESMGLASNPVEMKEFDVFRSHGLASSLIGWENELNRLYATLQRVSERPLVLSKLGVLGRQERALSRINAKIKNLTKRINLMGAPRYIRFLSILIFWLQGGYRDFSGWKSAMKDIIRP